MIGLMLIASSIFSEFPSWEEEFDPLENFFEEQKEAAPAMWSIIAEQKNRSELLSYVQEQQADLYEPNDQLEALLAPIIKNKTNVIDFGMGLGVFLSQQIKSEGTVYVFESRPEEFAKRFWQLNHHGASNAQLYCAVLEERQRSLDSYEIEDVSLFCIKADGREDLVLKGAFQVIKRDHPLLLIHVIGGLNVDQADRFVKEECQHRIDEIEKQGYRMTSIEGDLYLGVPL